MPGILGLLMLLHMAGAFRQPQIAMPQAPKRPEPNIPSPAVPSPSATPYAQGPAGVGQGHHGAFGPVMGGVGSMFNQAGLHPHQMNPQVSFNPFSSLAGLG